MEELARIHSSLPELTLYEVRVLENGQEGIFCYSDFEDANHSFNGMFINDGTMTLVEATYKTRLVAERELSRES